jgi:hypothetical protein
MFFALAIIFFGLLVGSSADTEIFGYKLFDLYYLLVLIGVIILFTWDLIRNRQKISFSTLKQELKIYYSTIKNVKKLPSDCKNIVLMGYLSIIIIFLAFICYMISNILFGPQNESWDGMFSVVILAIGFILYLYSIAIIAVKINKADNKSVLKTHLNLLIILSLSWVALNSLR